MGTVVVIGAGAVGASAAYHLSRLGHAVTVLEGRQAPGEGVSAATFSADPTHSKTPRSFFDLALASAKEHRSLATQLGGDASWRHPVEFFEATSADESSEYLRDRADRLESWSYPLERIDAERLHALVPECADWVGRNGFVVRYLHKAWYDAPRLIRELLAAAVHDGARLCLGESARGFAQSSGRITKVYTDNEHPADLVLNCAGPEAASIAAMASDDLPLRRVPGLVVLARPSAPSIRSVMITPRVNVRPAPDGLILIHSYLVDRQIGRTAISELASHALAHAADLVPGLSDATIQDAQVGVRPVPVDGLPVIGANRVGNLYHVVTHSAVHLAPLLGRLVADELTHPAVVPSLEPFHPQRASVDNGAGILDESTRRMLQHT